MDYTNIIDDEDYKYRREQLLVYVTKENLIKQRHIFNDDDGYYQDETHDYNINIEYYKTNGRDIALLVVTYSDGYNLKLLRNYPHMPLLVFKHNGKFYLATGEDYQGFTIINLTDRTIHSYVPKDWYHGTGWCVTYINWWDSDTNTLACEGCIWGCEETKRYYHIKDLDNPNFDDFTEESDYDDEDDQDELSNK